MILGFTCLALFLDGTLRLLGIIPPFLDIDMGIVDKIAEKVETELYLYSIKQKVIFQGYDFRNIFNTSSITICRTNNLLWYKEWL